MAKLIYIADDEENIRELIQQFLLREGYEVECFSNGKQLLDAFEEKKADLIVLDIMMPEVDGLTVCSSIRSYSNVPIIIVSAKDDALDRVTGISLGGDDYMVKPFLPLELVTRIKALFRRIQPVQDVASQLKTLMYGDMLLNLDLRTAYLKGDDFMVTPTEYDFLVYLIQNKDRAISRSELIKELWNYAVEYADTRVTDDLVKRLRKKLRDSNSSIQIETVWGFGFRLTDNNGGLVNKEVTI